MSSLFTRFVRSLAPEGNPPDATLFAELWSNLRSALVHEVKKRGLWSGPPSYLGVHGFSSWTETDGDGGDAIEELAAECYSFIFLDRLRSLKAHARTKESIDGLVFLNIRNFLHDTQKRCDPLGYRVFEVVRAGVGRLVDDGRFFVVAGPGDLRNGTVLSADRDARSEDVGPVSEEVVGRICDELLPGLVTARGDAFEELADQLADELAEAGIGTLGFKDLVDTFKHEVRGRWAALFAQAQGESSPDVDDELRRLVALVPPDLKVEEHDRFDALVAAVEAGIERLEARSKTRLYLARLWDFLTTFAGDPMSDKMPPAQRIAEELDIPRNRVPELLSTLGELLERSTRNLPPRRRRGARHRLWTVLAAVLAVAVLGLLFRTFSLDRRLEISEGPRLVPTTTNEVVFNDPVRGHPSVGVEATAAEEVAIYLDLGEIDPYPAYRLEVMDRDGGVVWRSGEKPVDPMIREYFLTIPREWLRGGGVYRLRLFGVAPGGGEEKFLAEEAMEIEIP